MKLIYLNFLLEFNILLLFMEVFLFKLSYIMSSPFNYPILFYYAQPINHFFFFLVAKNPPLITYEIK